MEIEINFRFDENGRTANTKKTADETTTCEDNKNKMNYDFKAEMTNLQELSESESMDEILLDCEISDYLMMPRTYWMPADGTKARCALEQFALDIFHHHVPVDGFDYDHEVSGAEWWCQLRPSPEITGRHSSVRCSDEQDGDADADGSKDPFTNGISFHVDKDEELRILTGGSTYVHPHLSTITYLTDLGSPTLIMDCQVHPLTGEWIVPEKSVEGFVSWPSVGKHTTFDGSYLHAAPPDLMGDKNAFEKQLEFATKKDKDEKNGTSKSRKRRHRRVTFLVNIWLNYRPYDVNPFPESMVDKMSGRDEKTRRGLKFTVSSSNNASTALHVQKTTIRSNQATEIAPEIEKDSSLSDIVYTAQQFSWPLGDKKSGEKLQCQVPLKSIIKSSQKGGNIQIQWQKKPNDVVDASCDEHNSNDDICFRLYDGKSDATTVTPRATSENNDTSANQVPDESSSNTDQQIPSDVKSAKRPRVD